MSEREGLKFTVREATKEQAPENQPKWRTAFVVVMNEQGKVLIDNNPGTFAHIVEHLATTQEALFMLGMALEEFKLEHIKSACFEAVKLELVRVSRQEAE